MCARTTPTIARSSEPFEKNASVDAPSATTGATAEEVDAVEDVGSTMGPARSGTTNLARIIGGTSVVKTVLRATLVSHRCRRQEGTKTINRTSGLGASKSHELSLVSWVELRP